jgi:phosphoribosylformimino-5-aminoimidazole carboxamide ribotide isomerase
MEVLPAIDLRGGKVVRLVQGDYARETRYSDDPASVARTFEAAGAKWIHVVDLDAAGQAAAEAGAGLGARVPNIKAVRAILSGASAKVEFGGGMRDDAAIEAMLHEGASRVVVGTAALRDWPWFERMLGKPGFAGKLALGLDARGGKLAVRGWTEQTALEAMDLARRVRGSGLGAIVYTDIARDGMLTGPNFAATAELVASTDVPVLASGGVSTLQDVAECRRIGCAGVIVGRAYYEGKIDLAAACALAAGRGSQ